MRLIWKFPSHTRIKDSSHWINLSLVKAPVSFNLAFRLSCLHAYVESFRTFGGFIAFYNVLLRYCKDRGRWTLRNVISDIWIALMLSFHVTSVFSDFFTPWAASTPQTSVYKVSTHSSFNLINCLNSISLYSIVHLVGLKEIVTKFALWLPLDN